MGVGNMFILLLVPLLPMSIVFILIGILNVNLKNQIKEEYAKNIILQCQKKEKTKFLYTMIIDNQQ